MEQIVDIFLSIGQFITSIFGFIIDIIEGLAYCVKLLAYFTANLPSYFSWLPLEFVVPIVTLIGIAVTYKLIGREG